MFKLLAILLALHFSSKVDGAPTRLEESGEYGAADDINQSDFILNDAELEDASDLEDGTTYNDGDEKDTETSGAEPSLQTRTLNDFKPTWRQRISRKFSSCCNPDVRENEAPTQATSHSTTPGGWSFENNRAAIEEDARRSMRESAMVAINDVQNLLSVPGADPYKDKNLAAKIEAAYYTNQDALNQPCPRLPGMTEEARLKYKFNAIKPAFGEARQFAAANPNYASYQLEKQRAYFPNSRKEFGAASTAGPATRRQASGYDLIME